MVSREPEIHQTLLFILFVLQHTVTSDDNVLLILTHPHQWVFIIVENVTDQAEPQTCIVMPTCADLSSMRSVTAQRWAQPIQCFPRDLSWPSGLMNGTECLNTLIPPFPSDAEICPPGAACHISETLLPYLFSSISNFNPLLYSSAVCFQPPLNLFWSNSTAMCTSVSKSESPEGGLSSKSCQEDKEAGQPSANCQCP